MKIRFVQLESDAFLTDIDFVQMSPAERGVYCSLIFLLNSSGGKCELDMQVLSRMCNCRGAGEFEKIWARISKKFQTRKGVIRHKRVTKELSKAKKMLQAKRKAGLSGAQKRWHSHSSDNGGGDSEPTAKERKEKETKSKDSDITNSNSLEQSCSSSTSVRDQMTDAGASGREFRKQASGFGRVGDLILTPEQLEQRRQSQVRALTSGKSSEVIHPLRNEEVTQWPAPGETRLAPDAKIRGLNFHEALAGIIRPRSRSDRTCFRNVTNWLVEGFTRGRFMEDVFVRVLDFAKEACNGERPAAVFMALLKKELGYGRE